MSRFLCVVDRDLFGTVDQKVSIDRFDATLTFFPSSSLQDNYKRSLRWFVIFLFLFENLCDDIEICDEIRIFRKVEFEICPSSSSRRRWYNCALSAVRNLPRESHVPSSIKRPANLSNPRHYTVRQIGREFIPYSISLSLSLSILQTWYSTGALNFRRFLFDRCSL